MIYTVTLNPSLDYIVTVKDFSTGKTNRTAQEQMFPGGKGINVSVVLNNLGVENIALGFTAGFVGEEIKKRIGEMGIRNEFLPVENGCSRINVKLKNYDGTEINGKGPEITKEALEAFWGRLKKLKNGDILVLAGSIPSGLPDSIYRDICEMLQGSGVEILVDATGKLLTEVFPYGPFLIKPNHHELGELFGVEIESREDALLYGEKLRKMGARNVLVSMGGRGAVLIDETGETHELPAPEGKLINAVGAGDSMVTGFLAGYLQTGDYGQAFRMAVASGSASAFSENLATKAEVEELYRILGKGQQATDRYQ